MGFHPAVFKTAALPIRTSPPDLHSWALRIPLVSCQFPPLSGAAAQRAEPLILQRKGTVLFGIPFVKAITLPDPWHPR
jgi:hypothetical protein